MGELASQAHFPFESRHRFGVQSTWLQQFHRRGASEHSVLSSVDDAHATFTDLFAQRVLPEAHGFSHLSHEAVDDVRDDHGDRGRSKDPSERADQQHGGCKHADLAALQRLLEATKNQRGKAE